MEVKGSKEDQEEYYRRDSRIRALQKDINAMQVEKWANKPMQLSGYMSRRNLKAGFNYEVQR